jgi:hypothetical protein
MKGWFGGGCKKSEESNYLKCLYALHRCKKQKQDKSQKIDWNAWDPFLYGVVCTESTIVIIPFLLFSLSLFLSYRKFIRLLC